jgi:hypothetical protein
MLLQIFLHRFFGFGYIDGEDDQALCSKLFVDLFDQRFFVMAVLAPCGPEFEQNNFAFDRFIIEALAGSSFCTEAWGGRSVLIGGEDSGREKQAQADREVRAKAHGGEIIAQRSWRESQIFMRNHCLELRRKGRELGRPSLFIRRFLLVLHEIFVVTRNASMVIRVMAPLYCGVS